MTSPQFTQLDVFTAVPLKGNPLAVLDDADIVLALKPNHAALADGRAPSQYVAAQGSALARARRVFVTRDADATWIGGDIAPCIAGRVSL